VIVFLRECGVTDKGKFHEATGLSSIENLDLTQTSMLPEPTRQEESGPRGWMLLLR
jgi:hypothetical protein